ncbi:(Fe-S)-binding protein [Tepidiforma thermophila]|uniref:Glycolate oxidase iron-sulfur subunit n=1 Tax=Tepidiforma thermophila (strain KCTC 52669 / CGMCC 1.13589 / G233) TaxID=2761530 RepID=A0A2A9HD10_TEPT2|nr:(Fe-S)-binding protein [Tepidiforma thermophila]PFG73897.1 glycolate oxidase iron-sulfur subunit [Tepidiforma thermophila]
MGSDGGVTTGRSGRWPNPAEAPAAEDLARCVHCGLCLTACPTYLVTGLEAESPRGRIQLARLVEEGRAELTAAVQGHWSRCLQCRACEAACPSGVSYGRIQEHARAQVQAAPPSGRTWLWVRRFVLRQVVARPRVLAAAAAPARRFAGWRFRGAAERVLPGRLGALARQLPANQGAPFHGLRGRSGAAAGEPVQLFTGCVMRELFGEVHRATVRVLERAGARVEATDAQRCCGALHAHEGDLEFARRLAKANITAFERTEGAVVVNSAGCGAALKEYPQLLAGEPGWQERAAAFAARVKDLSEWLAGRGMLPAGRLAARVAYQDACHLAHVQGIRKEPRALLRALDGCELVETEGADTCCGAAGLYGVVEPGMSAELRRRKAAAFAAARPDAVVTANPGCHLQYLGAVREAGLRAEVLHLAEALDRAWAGGDGR